MRLWHGPLRAHAIPVIPFGVALAVAVALEAAVAMKAALASHAASRKVNPFPPAGWIRPILGALAAKTQPNAVRKVVEGLRLRGSEKLFAADPFYRSPKAGLTFRKRAGMVHGCNPPTVSRPSSAFWIFSPGRAFA